MEPVSLWAAVEFTACNGSTEALLTAAARAGLHPYGVTALPGGFGGRCAAWQYPRLAALARRHRVRLRIRRKLGLYFRLRPLLRRAGLWAGLAVFVPLLLFAQQFVWYADTSSLTTGQAARACAVLREAGLQPGAAVTEAKLTAGEYALLHSGEFSWASLNFAKGRLVVEAAAARPKPDIAAGTLHGIRARCSGTVVRTNLVSGTMLVVPGQQVEVGQGLIGMARSERDGTLIFAPAAGTVLAQFEWNDTRTVLLEENVFQYTGGCTRSIELLVFGQAFALPAAAAPENAVFTTRHYQPELPLLGLALPCSIRETCRHEQQPETLRRTEEQAAALARLQSLQALYAAWPDAERIARKEDCTVNDDRLNYTVTYTIVADICGGKDSRCNSSKSMLN